ncbi:MAG: hypothetical protein D6820_12785, partial [Lentisphaerae bacterium]
SKFFEIDPIAASAEVIYSQSTRIGDFAFYQAHESACVTSDCETAGTLAGTISMNPTGNSDFSLEMITEDGTTVVRDDLMHNPTYEYNGGVTYLRFKPKCNGQQNLTLNGEPYQLDNQTVYVLQSSTPFTIHLYNSHANNGNGNGNTHGNAMGQWVIDLVNAPLTISTCDQSWEQDPPAEDPTEPEPSTPPFEITGGNVTPSEPVNTTFNVLGCAIVSGHTPCYVTAAINIDGRTYTPFGNPSNPYAGNINDNRQHSYDAGVLAAGTNVSVTGYCYLPNGRFYMSQSSAPSNPNVLVLGNGDAVPHIQGFQDQDSLEVYIADYIDTNSGTVSIQDNQAILLFELGTTNLNSAAADFQDMVMLITMTPSDSQ